MKKIEFIIINLLVTLFSLLPKQGGRYLGIFMGKLWFAFDKKHRIIALHNLSKVYSPKFSPRKIKKIAKNNFIFHAITFFEIIRLKRLSNKQILNEIDSVEGLDNYFSAKKKGKPVFMMSAHFGNWELMAAAAPLIIKHPIYLIARKLDSNALGKITNQIREKTGNKVIDKKQSATRVRQIIKEKQTIGILPDQKAMINVSVEAPFLGYMAKTNRGLALFDLRYKPEIVPIFSYRLKNGKYKLKIFPPLKRPKRTDFKKDIKIYTTIYNDFISREIYKNPEHWFWFHDRWKEKEALFSKKNK
ncbi:MAG: hypothetical protein CSA18_01195 [Deltaproteobacteria bacterium]|nr:MAG: hypothetical protein CSA18_01195 [Deltaproteobacteria bacterium]